jgi:hypothetical protein
VTAASRAGNEALKKLLDELQSKHRRWPARAKGVLISDSLHCDIHEMLESHAQGKEADLAGSRDTCSIGARRLDPDGTSDDQAMLRADVANLGGMLLQKIRKFVTQPAPVVQDTETSADYYR